MLNPPPSIPNIETADLKKQGFLKISHVDTGRPELIENVNNGAWTNVYNALEAGNAGIYTPLDRFGRVIPAHVWARSCVYEDADMVSFNDMLGHMQLGTTSWFRHVDKLGLTAIDYACLSPYRMEAARFLQLALSLAALQDEGTPIPNIQRAISSVMPDDVASSLEDARQILSLVHTNLQQSQDLIDHLLEDEFDYVALQGRRLRGTPSEIHTRFSNIIDAWDKVVLPDPLDVISCHEAQEALHDYVMSEGAVPPDKKIRQLLLNHMKYIAA